MFRLLLIDDEPSIQHAFRRAFREPPYVLRTAGSAAEGIECVGQERPDVIVLDVKLPDASGLETFAKLRAIDARIPVILITGHGTTDLAIEAMKQGAYEYLLKPLELSPLRELIDRACQSSRLMNVPASIPGEEPPLGRADVLVGRCAAMQEVYKAIGRVASQDVTVLILGESGTGKELVARAIYQHSRRADKPFLAINCAAIPEALLESELFGYEKGAFTGAERKRVGKFEQCSGGTIFLDEVGDMAPLTQVKILRLMQEQAFERLGGNETIRTDVRLIAATNVDLEQAVEESRFRRDLYFRLNVFSIRLPPMRERGDDLDRLAEHYVRRFAGELGKPVDGIAPDTWQVLRRHRWPGNVRELQSVLKQGLLQMRGRALLPEDLPPHLLGQATGSGPGEGFDWDSYVNGRIAAGSEDLYAETLSLMERELLMRVLRYVEGNQVQAARILGITRGSVRNKIKSLGISIGRSINADEEME